MNYSDLVGIPFDEHGDSLKGTNCFNLLRMALSIEGLEVPAVNIAVCACRKASNRAIAVDLLKYWKPIEKPEVGCGILIKSTDPNFCNHIGTYVGDNRILHITINTNSIIERLYPKFENKILGFYRFIGEKT